MISNVLSHRVLFSAVLLAPLLAAFSQISLAQKSDQKTLIAYTKFKKAISARNEDAIGPAMEELLELKGEDRIIKHLLAMVAKPDAHQLLDERLDGFFAFDTAVDYLGHRGQPAVDELLVFARGTGFLSNKTIVNSPLLSRSWLQNMGMAAKPYLNELMANRIKFEPPKAGELILVHLAISGHFSDVQKELKALVESHDRMSHLEAANAISQCPFDPLVDTLLPSLAKDYCFPPSTKKEKFDRGLEFHRCFFPLKEVGAAAIAKQLADNRQRSEGDLDPSCLTFLLVVPPSDELKNEFERLRDHPIESVKKKAEIFLNREQKKGLEMSVEEAKKLLAVKSEISLLPLFLAPSLTDEVYDLIENAQETSDIEWTCRKNMIRWKFRRKNDAIAALLKDYWKQSTYLAVSIAEFLSEEKVDSAILIPELKLAFQQYLARPRKNVKDVESISQTVSLIQLANQSGKDASVLLESFSKMESDSSQLVRLNAAMAFFWIDGNTEIPIRTIKKIFSEKPQSTTIFSEAVQMLSDLGDAGKPLSTNVTALYREAGPAVRNDCAEWLDQYVMTATKYRVENVQRGLRSGHSVRFRQYLRQVLEQGLPAKDLEKQLIGIMTYGRNRSRGIAACCLARDGLATDLLRAEIPNLLKSYTEYPYSVYAALAVDPTDKNALTELNSFLNRIPPSDYGQAVEPLRYLQSKSAFAEDLILPLAEKGPEESRNKVREVIRAIRKEIPYIPEKPKSSPEKPSQNSLRKRWLDDDQLMDELSFF